jgi:hypothetical protein
MLRISFRKWAWNRLYAKIWWGLAAAYWTMFCLSSYMKALNWLQEIVFPCLLVFHPFMMLPVMGFGTFERWWHRRDRGTWQPSEGDHPRRSDVGPSGLYWDIDPLDTRSGFFWSPSDKIH